MADQEAPNQLAGGEPGLRLEKGPAQLFEKPEEAVAYRYLPSSQRAQDDNIGKTDTGARRSRRGSSKQTTSAASQPQPKSHLGFSESTFENFKHIAQKLKARDQQASQNFIKTQASISQLEAKLLESNAKLEKQHNQAVASEKKAIVLEEKLSKLRDQNVKLQASQFQTQSLYVATEEKVREIQARVLTAEAAEVKTRASLVSVESSNRQLQETVTRLECAHAKAQSMLVAVEGKSRQLQATVATLESEKALSEALVVAAQTKCRQLEEAEVLLQAQLAECRARELQANTRAEQECIRTQEAEDKVVQLNTELELFHEVSLQMRSLIDQCEFPASIEESQARASLLQRFSPVFQPLSARQDLTELNTQQQLGEEDGDDATLQAQLHDLREQIGSMEQKWEGASGWESDGEVRQAGPSEQLSPQGSAQTRISGASRRAAAAVGELTAARACVGCPVTPCTTIAVSSPRPQQLGETVPDKRARRQSTRLSGNSPATDSGVTLAAAETVSEQSLSSSPQLSPGPSSSKQLTTTKRSRDQQQQPPPQRLTSKGSSKIVEHREEKKFCCSICGKSYGKAWNLKQHVRCVHLSPQIVTCDICQANFKHKSSLVSHMIKNHVSKNIVVKGKHSCKLCDKTFAFKGSLTRHQVRSHGEQFKPHKCPICKKFYSQYALPSHMYKAHRKTK